MTMTIPAPKVFTCPRCRKEIGIGEEIAPHDPQPGKKTVWGHKDCKPARPVPAATIQAAKPPAEVVNSDVRRVVNDTIPAIVEEVYNQVAGEANATLEALTESVNLQVRGVVGGISRAVADQVGGFKSEVEDRLASQRAELIELAESQRRVVIEVRSGGEILLGEDEVYHEAFPEVLELLTAGENVFLPGPAGCGKTHLCEQAARHMGNPDGTFGRPFGVISGSAGVTEAEVKGTSIPNLSNGENVYVPSRFLQLFEQGGVFLVDEADGMDPNVLLTINAALANGFLAVPKRTAAPIAHRHPLFCCVFAANTFGRGADRQYVGRNRLDLATLDRFCVGFVPLDYSEAIERRLCPDRGLYQTLMTWREKIVETKLSRILSTRFVAGAARAKARGKDVNYIARKLTLDQGWTYDEACKVIGDQRAREIGYKI